MELKDALRKLLLSRGAQVLDDIRLANMLADFKAFEEQPAVRYLIKACLSEGIMQEIIDAYNEGENSIVKLNDLKSRLNLTYGFREDLSNFFIENLISAFGWQNDALTVEVDKLTTNKSIANSFSESISNIGNHLTFKGIPICGNPEATVQKIVSIGFNLSLPYSVSMHLASLQGTFTGVNDCTIIVQGTPKSNTVYLIGVLFPQAVDWFSLKSKYLSYKEKLSKKYGVPQTAEFFQDPYYEGDGYEMSAVSTNNCNYLSTFELANGNISVSISSGQQVLVMYQDKQGKDLYDAEMNDLAEDDL